MRSAVLLLLFVGFFSQTVEESSTLYQKQAFDHALNLYSKKSYKTASDWYMMGNAAFYKGNYLHALVFWYQSALAGNPFYTSYALENSNQARVKLGFEKIRELPLLYPFQINELGVGFFWALFFSLLVWMLIFALIFYYKFKLLFVRLLVLIGCITVCFCVCQKLRLHHNGYFGIVVSKIVVAMRAGPSDEYHVIEQIAPGELVIVVFENSDWCKIYYKKSFGWLASNSLATAHSAAQLYNTMPTMLE